MAEIFVTTSKDSGKGSLRDAIAKANANVGKTTKIIIKDSVGDTIKLTTGELTVRSNVKIINNRDKNLTIKSEMKHQRLFSVTSPSKELSIISENDIKIILTNGSTISNGGAIAVEPTDHKLTLKNVIILNNKASKGGGIYTNGSVILDKSEVKLNVAKVQGAGIWSTGNIIMNKSKVIKNEIPVANNSNGGAGIFIDNGDCILDRSSVNDNHVNYNKDTGVGGSGGGIVVLVGTIYVQNYSHVDNNSAYNSGGIQEGQGNIYLTNNSTANNNRSFNDTRGSAGGGGITITLGAVYVSNSQINDNKTVGMFSAGIVSLVGNVVVTNNSQIMRNSNRGPGGGVAINVGGVTINESSVCENRGASLGGGIVSFTPHPGFVSITNSKICNNTLTNAENIRQTIEAFLSVIIGSLDTQKGQATVSGGEGGMQFIEQIPAIIKQITEVFLELKKLPIDAVLPGKHIGGGGVASFLTSSIMINNSEINNNFAGENVSAENHPFSAIGGGIFGFSAPIDIQNSTIKGNKSVSSGAGIWSSQALNIAGSNISENKITKQGNGGGIFNVRESKITLIDVNITNNVAKGGKGGGIFSDTAPYRKNTNITNNSPDNVVIV